MWQKLKSNFFFAVLIGLLAFGFYLRLYKVDNPIADWHSWRQADTAAVTRNFIKHGVNMLYPRYDDFSDVSGRGANPNGYRFVEFPIFNFIHWSLYHLNPDFGVDYWGRMTSIIGSLISAVFLYVIVSKKLNNAIASVAVFFFLVLPYNVYYSRVVLPDPWMVTFVLGALAFFEYKKYVITILFGSLALLTKPTAIFFLSPLIVQPWLLVPMLIPVGVWRWWETKFPEGIPANTWLLNGNGIRFKGAFFRWLFGERIASLILGKWGLVFLGQGLIGAEKFGLWLFGAVAYLVVFATGNVQHDYYQIPIIPIISILLAIGVVRMWQTNIVAKLLIFPIILLTLALSWYDVRGYYQINNWSIVKAGKAADKLLPQGAIIIAPYQGDTAFLYQTNRPGFPVLTESIEGLKSKFGVTHFVSVNYDDDTRKVMHDYKILEETPEYVIVEL